MPATPVPSNPYDPDALSELVRSQLSRVPPRDQPKPRAVRLVVGPGRPRLLYVDDGTEAMAGLLWNVVEVAAVPKVVGPNRHTPVVVVEIEIAELLGEWPNLKVRL